MRNVFTSVPELIGAIDEYIAHHNTQPKPFIWTKSARDTLQKSHSRQQPLKVQTECSTTLASINGCQLWQVGLTFGKTILVRRQ